MYVCTVYIQHKVTYWIKYDDTAYIIYFEQLLLSAEKRAPNYGVRGGMTLNLLPLTSVYERASSLL